MYRPSTAEVRDARTMTALGDAGIMHLEGIYTYEDLRERGYSRAGIAKALAEGVIERVAHGLYAEVIADQNVVRGLKLGGKLGCLSGCKFYGIWTPPDSALHVIFTSKGMTPAGAAVTGVCAHVRPRKWTKDPVWSLMECLDHVIRFHDGETVLIVLESAVHKGMITIDDAVVLLADHPRKAAKLLKHLDAAESGSETRVRLVLRQRNLPVTPQVWITSEDRVDLLVGESLIIECDSKEFHSSQESYEKDRERDTRMRTMGFDVWRLSYRQVWWEWESTQMDLDVEIRRRKYRKKPNRYPNVAY
ncbi:MAG: type IV toxin-antitoxin system AbiEi family antitoxin domain-containing protein [Ancrocorticia sp.]